MFGLPQVPQVDVEEVKNSIDQKDGSILLDVRTEMETARGMLPGAINIPLDSIEKDVESKLSGKNDKIYVYCLSGSRSPFAVDFMVKAGYKNVFDVKNGLLAWRAKGFSL